MTQEQPTATPKLTVPKLTVHGAWHGEVSDPERHFRGKVTESEHPALPEGQTVTVRYSGSDKRVVGAAEHGRYVLSDAAQSYPLVSFTCRSAATTGRQGTDDTEAADWQVVVLAE